MSLYNLRLNVVFSALFTLTVKYMKQYKTFYHHFNFFSYHLYLNCWNSELLLSQSCFLPNCSQWIPPSSPITAKYGWTMWAYSESDEWSAVFIVVLHINSLALERLQSNFRSVIFKLTLVNGGWGISYVIALRWMPLDLTDDKSTIKLVQVMAWCCQATSHYLSQCWLRSMSPNGVTRPQWVNILHSAWLLYSPC